MAAIGDAVGRPEEAAGLVRAYDEHAAAIATTHADALARTKRVTFNPADAGQWFLLSPAWTANAVLADADVILVPADTTGAIDPIMQPFLDAPLWQALLAVTAGTVFPAPSGTSSLGMGRSCSRRSTRSSRGWRRSPAERCRQAAALGRDAGRSGLLVSAAVYLNEFADDLAPKDMRASAEFASLLESAADLGIPHDAVGALRVAPGRRARHALPLHRVG